MHWIITVTRILAFCFGVVVLYVALLLDETEEGVLQNRLENVWIKSDDLRRAAMSSEAQLIARGSGFAIRLIDLLIDANELSIRDFRTCLFLSFSSFFLSISFIQRRSVIAITSFIIPTTEHSLLLGITILWFGLACASARSSKRWIDVVLYLIAGWAFTYLPLQPPDFVDGSLMVLLLICCIGFDLAFFRTLRWALRLVACAARAVTMSGILACSLLLVSALAVPAVTVSLQDSTFDLALYHAIQKWYPPLPLGIGLSSAIDILCVVLLVICVCVALLNHLLWPIIQRPLYAAHRKELLSNTKLGVSIGLTALLYSLPHPFRSIIVMIHEATHF